MAQTVVSAHPSTSSDGSTHVLDVAAHFLGLAAQAGTTMTVEQLHFLCYQVQGWTLAVTGQPAFEQTIYAESGGIRIDELRDAYAPLGAGPFTLQDALDAGIVTVLAANDEHKRVQP